MLLRVLGLPRGKKGEALRLLEWHSESFDLEARKKKYRSRPRYGLSCKIDGVCSRAAASSKACARPRIARLPSRTCR